MTQANEPNGCPSSRHDVDWSEVALADRMSFELATAGDGVVSSSSPAVTIDIDSDTVLSAASRLLDADGHAAYMVAACVNTVQTSNETRPAFVKRIVRAWIDEMGRGALPE